MTAQARTPLGALGAILAVALAIALGACGGGGSSSSSTASGPTHARYVASANAICATARTQTAPLIAKIKSAAASVLTGGSAALAAPVRRLRDVAAANLAKLRALEPPAGDEAAIARILRPLAKIVSDIGTAGRDLAKGEALGAYALIQQAVPLASRVADAARAYGARQCGLVLSTLS